MGHKALTYGKPQRGPTVAIGHRQQRPFVSILEQVNKNAEQ